MIIHRVALVALLVATIGGSAALPLHGQQPDTSMIAAKRSMVTRSELQAAYDEIQRGLASPGYSSAIRKAKQVEADLIRTRLDEGDIRPADQISVRILGVEGLSGTYVVTPARTLALPSRTEIPMRGILRSEVQDYLTKQFGRYVNDPVLTASTSIRISLFGALGKPGFYQAPASTLLSEEIMKDGGGPAPNVDWKKSTIQRGERIIVDGPEFVLAVQNGMTLDQLNIQAGDVIHLAEKPSSGFFWRVVGAVSALAGVVYLVVRVL